MPSQAYSEYRKNLADVRRLVSAHDRENSDNPGKRGLGHYTRGGLLLLCAAWERYTESVLEESALFLTQHLANFADLPLAAATKTRDHANSNKTAWTAVDLTTATWKDVYADALKVRTAALNTPKHENLRPLFSTFLGLADIESAWPAGKNPIDDFVAHRGEVAHRGGQSKYVRIARLNLSDALVLKYTVDTDNFLSDHLRLLVTPNQRPWNRIL